MKVTITRTFELLNLRKKGNERTAWDVAEGYGFKHVQALDIENRQEIQWQGVEFNRLYALDDELWRFNEWYGVYPFDGIVLERIGTIEEDV